MWNPYEVKDMNPYQRRESLAFGQGSYRVSSASLSLSDAGPLPQPGEHHFCSFTDLTLLLYIDILTSLQESDQGVLTEAEVERNRTERG